MISPFDFIIVLNITDYALKINCPEMNNTKMRLHKKSISPFDDMLFDAAFFKT